MLLYRIARVAVRARRWFALGWIAILVALLLTAVALGGRLQDDFAIPGTESQVGLERLNSRFDMLSGVTGQLVVHTTDGSDVREHAEVVSGTAERAADLEHVRFAQDPLDEDFPGEISPDGTTTIIPVQYDAEITDIPGDTGDHLAALATEASTDTVQIYAGGPVMGDTGVPVNVTELIGVVLALIVLAVTFRSKRAAGVPILSALLSVGTAMALILIAASFINLSTTTPTLSIMLGLAVGIDYALFIMARYRSELAEGQSVAEAVARATATAGSAVVFAGMTVIIALVGLFIVGLPFLTGMGFAAAGAVALAVLASTTFLPALLGLFGERLRPRPGTAAYRLALPVDSPLLTSAPTANTPNTASAASAASTANTASTAGTTSAASTAPTSSGGGDGSSPAGRASRRAAARHKKRMSERWIDVVMRFPVPVIAGIIVVLALIAIPAKDLTLGLPDEGTQPVGSQPREAYDVVAEAFGPGYNTPLLITVDIINSTDPLGVMDSLSEDVRAIEGVADVGAATPNPTADMGIIQVVPEEGQAHPATADLVAELRAQAPVLEERYDVSDLTVTGYTAVAVDLSERLGRALLPFGLFVVGLSLVLLTVVFRSFWVPLTAAGGYLLSILVAFGATAMVFEYGWLNNALGIGQVGAVISFMPIIVMGVLFGLAMDYQVFLVSRMRERYVHTGDARGSVRSGFTSTARVVTAAALIMFAIFAFFVPESDFYVQPIAFALAVGIAVDAFVIRMTLIPAILTLLGDRAWRLPGAVDRALPHMDVEGMGLERQLAHAAWTDKHGPVAVRLEDVSVQPHGGSAVLSGVTMYLKPGGRTQIFATDEEELRTLMGVIGARLDPTSGTAVIDNHVLPDDSSAAAARVLVLSDVQSLITFASRPTRNAGREPALVVLSRPGYLDAEPVVQALETLRDRGITVVVGSLPGDPAAPGADTVDLHSTPATRAPLGVSR